MGFQGNWFRILIKIILLTLLVMCFEADGCLEQERAALQQLKANLRGVDNIFMLHGWKDDDTSDCCDSWEGVTCGPNQRVVSLKLSNAVELNCTTSCDKFGVQLNASILLPLQELGHLDLSYNSLSSLIQPKGLPKLELLDLRGNNFNCSILSNLSGLSSLKILILQENQLTGSLQLHDIEAMKNMQELDVSHNSLSSIVNYGELPNLELLDLSFNNINGCILSKLGEMPFLKVLRLQGNNLSGPLQLHDIDAIKNLEELNLSDNNISRIMNYRGCGQMQKLQQLFLSSNGLKSLPCLGNLTSLQKVDLSNNQLSGNIPSWLKNWTKLRQLDLSRNKFAGNIGLSPLVNLLSLEALELIDNHLQIPHSFGAFVNHTKLKYFVGDSNQVIFDSERNVQSSYPGLQLEVLTLSSCGLGTLPLILQSQNKLSFIDLSHNSLQGNFPNWLLQNNLQLEALFFKNNSLSGDLQFPSFVNDYITEIDISFNKIQGSIPANVSVVFPNLTALDMSNNEFNGTIPPDFGRMRSLSYLQLSNNHFSGELPSFQAFRSLDFLDLSGNNFSGPIRASMFSFLHTLNLSNNSLEGSIPEDLFNVYISFLDLSHNMLNGTLPSTNELSGISILHLNNNRLSGQITDEFYNTSLLEVLDLSNNALSGQIPCGLGNLSILGTLLLRGNRFSGEIPVQLCNSPSLTILDLSYNNLSGPIPPCLFKLSPDVSRIEPPYVEGPAFKAEDSVSQATNNEVNPSSATLKPEPTDFFTKGMLYPYEGRILIQLFGIDLSCNELTGVIPSEIGNITQLRGLNLSHNNLWGAIPPTFSNLKNIESLDVSYNNLNGSIPVGIVALNTLEVFSVAHNNLSGMIPFTAQFSTFTVSSYDGNPFLCGSPLPKNCTAGEFPSINTNASEHKVAEDDDGWIDMSTFYVTFTVVSVIMFLATITSLFINPNWQRAWLHLVEACVTSIYYFLEDTIRKLRRVRNVR